MSDLRLGLTLTLLAGIVVAICVFTVMTFFAIIAILEPSVDGTPGPLASREGLAGVIAMPLCIVVLIPVAVFLMRKFNGPPTTVVLSLIALPVGITLVATSAAIMDTSPRTTSAGLARSSGIFAGIVTIILSGLHLLVKSGLLK